ncbi:phospholipase A [Stenoxybacter acetivorans]|uniref:phospholipase A n=1 Tax=Stenoxybacter acetivorans TaxID=422441 RepID=UPI000B337D26|nr:phospholipase A [Stenoxybacter acetivorans]
MNFSFNPFHAVLAALVFSSSLIAYAEETATVCVGITNDTERLACFDRAYASVSPSDNESEKPAIDLIQTLDKSLDNDRVDIVLIPQNQELPESISSLSELYDLDRNDESGTFTMREHYPMYLLPLWHNSRPNYRMHTPTQTKVIDNKKEQQKTEAKMQLSFKTKIAQDLFKTRADLWFGYTQQSHWQVYNGYTSAEFRNTDYMPEFFITQPVSAPLPFNGKLRMLGAGYLHQSNGQSDPLSRSWNRAYVMAGMEWGRLTVLPRLWWRIPENHSDDNNPDITRYMGYGDLRLQYHFAHKQTFGSTLRFNPATGKGGMQVDYTFPLAGKLKAYIQGYSGYGESLLDYNHRHRSIGIGLMLNDWDGF